MFKRLVLPTVFFILFALAAFRIWFPADASIASNDESALSQLFRKEQHLNIPSAPGFYWINTQEGHLFVRAGSESLNTQEVDLCRMRKAPYRTDLLPIIVGVTWEQLKQHYIKGKTADLAHYGIQAPLLDDSGFDIPWIHIVGLTETGYEDHPYSLAVELRNAEEKAVFAIADNLLGDLSTPTYFSNQLWLVWSDPGVKHDPDAITLGSRALSVEWHDSTACELGALKFTTWFINPDASKPYWPYNYIKGVDIAAQGTIRSGEFNFAAENEIKLEDQTLFEAAMKEQLIKLDSDTDQLLVAPNGLQQVFEGNAELLDARWASLDWSPTRRRLLKSLYQSDNGSYVRRQVNEYNQQRLSAAALRVHLTSSEEEVSVTAVNAANNQPLPKQQERPFAGEKLVGLDERWTKWHVVRPESNQTSVSFTLDTPTRRAVELMVLGRLQDVDGGHILSKEAVCRFCASDEMVTRIKIKPTSDRLSIKVAPLPHPMVEPFFREQRFLHLAKTDVGMVWRAASQANASELQPVQVTIETADGVKLYDSSLGDTEDTAESEDTTYSQDNNAIAAHYGAVLGVAGYRRGFLPEQLARLGGNEQHARLSLSDRAQTQAQQALSLGLSKLEPNPQRFASFTILNVDGGILASVSYPNLAGLPADGLRLKAFEQRHYFQSPLRFRAGYHDGSGRHASGSVMKVATALGLEKAAQTNQLIERLLNGQSLDLLAQTFSRSGYAFHPQAYCYPFNGLCRAPRTHEIRALLKLSGESRLPAMHNFRSRISGYQSPADRAKRFHDEQYGLAQAIRDSMNSWFAYLAHVSEQSTFGSANASGIVDALPLVPNALNEVRPLYWALDHAGFFKPVLLDGGLFPKAYRWRDADILRTSASTVQAPQSVSQLLRTVVGEKNTVTPLHIAKLMLAVANGGKVITPTLLASLNGLHANPEIETELNVRLDRIRKGMNAVVSHGTAAGAFADFDDKAHMYAKTGTASVPGHTNNAWMAGFYEPRTSDKLVFVCHISDTSATGGEACGPVVKTFLQQWLEIPGNYTSV